MFAINVLNVIPTMLGSENKILQTQVRCAHISKKYCVMRL